LPLESSIWKQSPLSCFQNKN